MTSRQSAFAFALATALWAGAFANSASAETAVPLKPWQSPPVPGGLDRPIDPVIIPGSQLHTFAGKPIASMRIYSVREGKLVPIPYQIDEKNEDDEYVLTSGPEKSKDEDKGLLDANDELVFMASDLGERMTSGDDLPEVLFRKELIIRDPVDGKRAYAYLFLFGGTPPAPSPVDYVTYDPEADEGRTRTFSLGFDKKLKFAIKTVRTRLADGSFSENSVDIMKIRMNAKVLGFDLTRDQTDFSSKRGGWIDGPVRAIKYSGMSVRLVAFLQSPKLWNYTFFYPYALSYDFDVKTPFPIGKVTSKFSLIGGVDFMDLRGAEIYSTGFPKPYVVTGVAGSKDLEAVNAGGYSTGFVAVKHRDMYFLTRIITPKDVPLIPDIYLVDDPGLNDPPEYQPGAVPGLYFNIRNWENVFATSFKIKNFVIVTDQFVPGDEKAFFKKFDTALVLDNPDPG